MNGGEQASRLQEANAELQARMETEKAYRREERFLWVITTFALVDVILFGDADSKVVPVIFAVFQLIILSVMAERLGVRNVARSVDRVLEAVAGESKPKPGE